MDIQAYVPLRFVTQLGFTLGVAGSPSSMRLQYGCLEDAQNAWAFATACQTEARYKYP